jgi:hypothetical protein
VATRAKFYVTGLTLLPPGQGCRLNLSAVCRGERNRDFATATPSGSMEMMIQNPAAVQWWEDFVNTARATGKQPELFIDIYPSEDGWPGDGHKFTPSGGEPGTIYGPDKCAECGMLQDATFAERYEWNEETKRSEPVNPGPVHPNG